MHVSADGANNPDPNGCRPKTICGRPRRHVNIFFSSGQKLTKLAGGAPAVPDLYRYDVAGGTLTDLTTSIPTEPASRA